MMRQLNNRATSVHWTAPPAAGTTGIVLARRRRRLRLTAAGAILLGGLPLPFQILVRLLSLHHNPVHNRVKGRTVLALHAQKVPRAPLFAPLAVVAGHGHDARQLRRHRLQGDARRDGGPRGHHALGRFGRLLADGAAAVVRGQLAEALPVDGVAAGHFVRGAAAVEQKLLADGAVRPVLARLAVVVREQGPVDAHAALGAVRKALAAADAAKAALVAVVRPLLVRHPQVADAAVVGAKLGPARHTGVGFAALTGIAFAANDFDDGEAINRVVVVLRHLAYWATALFHTGKAGRE